jgi:hypothetical protein
VYLKRIKNISKDAHDQICLVRLQIAQLRGIWAETAPGHSAMRASKTIVLRIPMIFHVNFCKFLYDTVYCKSTCMYMRLGRAARDETFRDQLCTAPCFENSVTNMFS